MTQLSELKELLSKATPGKLTQGYSDGSGLECICVEGNKQYAATVWGCGCCQSEPNEKDFQKAALIVASVNALPELIQRIEEYEAALKFYADSDCYPTQMDRDNGQCARDVLEKWQSK